MKSTLWICLIFFLMSCQRETITQETATSIMTTANESLKTDAQYPNGWWISINTSEQEAKQIQFYFGTNQGNEERSTLFDSGLWDSSYGLYFAVDPKYKNVKQLYVKASSVPETQDSFFYVWYNNCVIRKFDFDATEDAEMDQDDHLVCAK